MAVLLQQRCHLPQQLQAGNTGVAGIAVREQLADVPAADASQQRIGDSMRQHVASECPKRPRT